MILSFFVLLIGGMFIAGGVTASAMNIGVLVLVLGIVSMGLYEMYNLIHADE
jgi:hypothetical protein